MDTLHDTLAALGTHVASNPRDTTDDADRHDFDTYPLELADAAERYTADDALHESCTVRMTREDGPRVIHSLRDARDAMFDRTDPGWRKYTDLIAPHYRSVRMSDYVTRSGRARPTGRVTRLSHTVGKPKRVKPLPLRLQVRPQALAPLSRNQGCYTFYPVSGPMIHFRDTLAGTDYAFGRGLDGRGRWNLYVQGHGNFRHGAAVEALGWARAAEMHGYTVTVTEA